jgi:FkbM family methyltransferase
MIERNLSMTDTAMRTLIRVVRRFFPAFLRTRIRVLMFQLLNLAWRLPSGILIRLANYGDWMVYNEIFTSGEYDMAIAQAFGSRDASQPLHVVDLGAHVGFFTLRVVDLLRQRQCDENGLTITAVEGSRRSVQEWRSRVLVENALSKQARVIHGLVGRRAGVARLYEAILPSQNSMLQEVGAGLQVDYVNLDALFVDAPCIELLKCDIEGAELLFIQNYPELLRKVHVAVFESLSYTRVSAMFLNVVVFCMNTDLPNMLFFVTRSSIRLNVFDGRTSAKTTASPSVFSS